jgi:hypothetical protein
MAKAAEDVLEGKLKAGAANPHIQFLLAKATRLEAEIEVLRAKEKPVPKKLETERRDVIKERVAVYRQVRKSGAGDIVFTLYSIYQGSKELCQAELDLCEKPSERVAAWEKLLDVAKEVEGIFEKQFKAGTGSESNFQRAKAERLSAEIDLLRENIKVRSADK